MLLTNKPQSNVRPFEYYYTVHSPQQKQLVMAKHKICFHGVWHCKSSSLPLFLFCHNIQFSESALIHLHTHMHTYMHTP